MPNVSVTISRPTLGVGESFKERHRLLPSGAWSTYTSRTNGTFTLSLTAGTWEIQVYLEKADGTICPETTTTTTVVEPPSEDPYVCPDFTTTFLTNPARISISYTPGTGTPACGYQVRYKKTGTSTWGSPILYPTLPTSPFTIYLPSLQSYDVQILANQCDGFDICYEETVSPPAPTECVGLSGFDFSVQEIENPQSQQKKFQLTITASTQSTIPTTSITAIATQTYNLLPSLPWSGSSPITGISPTAFSFTMILYYNGYTNGARLPASTTYPYRWEVSFVDGCGKTHRILINYP